jgi:hypothetical protein
MVWWAPSPIRAATAWRNLAVAAVITSFIQTQEDPVPEKQTLKRARQDKAQGKSASTQAGEFVREEIRHVREGKHGARSPQQAIAIGLSKARRAGVPLRPPKRGKTSERTRRTAILAFREGQGSPGRQPSRHRSRATLGALKREGHAAVSRAELARQGRSAAARRTERERSRAARRAIATKGRAGRSAAAKKAAQSRARPKR